MTQEPRLEGDQTFNQENQITTSSSQRKVKKNQTDNVKWSIFTEVETKIIAGKAAKKAGLKLNEWIDRALRQQGTDELTKKAEPPAKTEDLVKDIVSQFVDKFKAAQDATAQQHSDQLAKQAEQIDQLTKSIQSQPRTFKEFFFGKGGS